jgi:hypothetical protein
MGIGTVQLKVKKAPGLKGKRSHHTLVLNNVLYVPSALCNIIGITKDFCPDISGKGLIDQQGRNIAYFDPRCTLAVIKLSGPPVGPIVGDSIFRKDRNDGKMYMINAIWSSEERRKWETRQQESEKSGAKSSPETPYSQTEKAWLKKHYRDEYHFLLDHGLKIYNEEDRLEGQEIVRALMRDSDDNDDYQESEDDEDKLTGHMTDYLFSEAELEFIDQMWKNSMNFLAAYRLKFYDQDDCDEAKQLVKVLMTQD